MTTTDQINPEIAPPSGAEIVGEWDLVGDTGSYRLISGVDRTVTDHTVRVYATAEQQLVGGTTGADVSLAHPSVYVAAGELLGLDPLNSDQARELASALLEAAAEIDRWAGR